MKLVLAEKPSVAQSIAKVLGAAKREDGYLEGNGYVVSWCVGHLVELAQPEVYDAKYSKWAYADLPIFPMDWQYEVSAGTLTKRHTHRSEPVLNPNSRSRNTSSTISMLPRTFRSGVRWTSRNTVPLMMPCEPTMHFLTRREKPWVQ